MLVATRGRLMQGARSDGSMLSVAASEEEVATYLSSFAHRVSVAAVNGPASVVVSGDDDAVQQLGALLTAAGRRTRPLRTSHAFHSAHMDGILMAFRRAVAAVPTGEPDVPIVSNLTGRLLTTRQLKSPDYWVQHLRQAVQYWAGVQCLQVNGATTFVDLGPGASLAAMTRRILADTADGVYTIETMGVDLPEPGGVQAAVARWK
jgi:acyl transferase domain-containing protein